MSESETEATQGAPASGEQEPKQDGDKSTGSLLGTLAERSEEAVKKVYGELSDNPRMQDAKDRLGKASHTVLAQLNVASQDDVSALRDEVARLEQRLAVLEQKFESGSKTGKDPAGA